MAFTPFTPDKAGFFQPNSANADDLVKQREKERLTEFRTNINNQASQMPSHERGLFSTFATLGDSLNTAIEGKSPSALTPDEQQGFQVIEGFNQGMRELKQDPTFNALSPAEQSFRTQKLMADKAAEAGDYGTYSNITRSIYENRLKHRQQTSELEKLESDNRVTRRQEEGKLLAADANVENLEKGLPEQFVRMENGQPNLEAPVTLRQDATGQLRDEQGNTVPWSEVMLFDNAMSMADTLSKTGRKAPTMKGFVNDLYSPTEIKQLREGMADIEQVVAINKQLVDAFSGSTDPEQIVGTQGGLLSLANNVTRAISGTVKNIQSFTSLDDKGRGIGPGKGLNDLGEEFIEDDMIPSEFRDNAEARANYRSAIMQMVYADARLNEPGARQLSDADISNAMDRLGARNGDPRIVLDVFTQNNANRLGTMRGKYERYGATGDHYGIGQDKAFQVLGADPLELIDSSRKQLETQFQQGEAALQDTPNNALNVDSNLSASDASLVNDILNR